MDLQEELTSDTYPIWRSINPPIYDIRKTYLENLYHGPRFKGDLPARSFPAPHTWVDFLGYKVASRIGVPAGPLLSSEWIALASKLGFDILTYKTIRTRLHPAHPLPNMLYVDVHPDHATCRVTPQRDIAQLAVTNSFGMPSMCQEFLMEDIARAKSLLHKGQVLVVSVVGSKDPHIDFVQDFVEAALFAKRAGASIVEANFSCPNIGATEGQLYTSADSVYDLAKKIKTAIKETPLILKMGTFQHTDQMKDVLVAAAKAGVAAISGINTVSMKVIYKNGIPALGHKRPTSGICGGAIRPAALEFIKHASTIIKQERLDLTLIGVGGITLPHHFALFAEAGADFMQTATGMMWDPYLGLRYHSSKEQL